jgi:hypothetical protein
MQEQCRNAYRIWNRDGLYCRLMDGRSNPYCAHTYFCPNTRRWEARGDCPIRDSEKKS